MNNCIQILPQLYIYQGIINQRQKKMQSLYNEVCKESQVKRRIQVVVLNGNVIEKQTALIQIVMELLILCFKIRIQILYNINMKSNKGKPKTCKQDNFTTPTPNKKLNQDISKIHDDNPIFHLRDFSPINELATATTKVISKNWCTMQIVETPYPVDKTNDLFSNISIIQRKISFSPSSESDQQETPSQRTPISSESQIQDESALNSSQLLQSQEDKPLTPVPSFPLPYKSKPKITTLQNKKVTCNCKKTKCLKLYCDCFRDNQSCSDTCNCVGCHNNDQYQIQRTKAILQLLERDPSGFLPKIGKEQHSKGCHCKKSHCQKRYCQCYQAGLACGELCKCDECKNNVNRSDCNHKNINNKMTTKKEPRLVEERDSQ